MSDKDKLPHWNDAALLALSRDSRSWLTMSGDYVDMRSHVPILYSIARQVCWPDPYAQAPNSSPVALEIGVRSGISTLAILHAMRETNGRLISVDCDEEQTFLARASVSVAGLSPWWEFQCALSDDFVHSAPERLDLLLIDGDHSEEQVRKDIKNYLPRVRANGICLMHDYYNDAGCFELSGSGTAVVAHELKKQVGKYEVLTLPFSYGLTIVRVLTQ